MRTAAVAWRVDHSLCGRQMDENTQFIRITDSQFYVQTEDDGDCLRKEELGYVGSFSSTDLVV